ncbi:hypothetical protein CROQUDRAFT_661301 [Cronartium quercuum f. sp. fusiforme G11]|uniref:F-box domain-containing protein n=1 Tax=Cronartium quercuum f. sp. fusiforme G11 TaxID=708437 RepID=A0A9P6NB86_9BASI|nr:hypothetical protein CROQUDRAFT_661301 [Cronartium quercuum f. sp. fusiforme G11]
MYYHQINNFSAQSITSKSLSLSSNLTPTHIPSIIPSAIPLPILPHHPLNTLPNELLLEIFKSLPSLDQGLDILSACLVCRKWRGPAQTVLWGYLRFPHVDCVIAFAEASKLRPDLTGLARRLNFFTDDPEYLASLDADAVFCSMESLTGLERFEVTVPYASGELYDSLCEELSGAPVREILLAAEEGIGRGHVQASMRFPRLALLHLVGLGPLGDLASLAMDWSCPSTLTELVLVKPDLPGSHFDFLLSHTRPTLRTLRLDFKDLKAEETQLTEEDVSSALLRYGDCLTELELMWPYATYPCLNQAVVGLTQVRHIVTSGVTCDENMDRNCLPTLVSMDIHVVIGCSASTFEKLCDPTFRRSNITRYHIVTRREERECLPATSYH